MIRLATLLSALLLLRPHDAGSCGWHYTGEEFRFWLLRPELAEMRELRAFNFSTAKYFSYDTDAVVRLPYAVNIAEWQAIVGHQVPDTAIEAILYGTAPEHYLKEESAFRRNNAFVRRLERLGPQWAAFIRYAKTCEQLVSRDDPWDFEPFDPQAIRRAWDEGQRMLRAAKDERLRARIAFQLVRLAHYHRDDEGPALNAAAHYERHLAPLRGRSWLEGAAAFYLAGRMANPARDMAFAEIFPRTPDKQFRMLQLFDNSSFDMYMEGATSDAQRATLLVMRGLQHPGRALGDLERIAALDPASPFLPQLVGREVNKLEDWLLTPALTELGAGSRLWSDLAEVHPDDVYRADLEYLHAVQRFITQRLQHAATVHKPVLRLLNAHLDLVRGDAAACRAGMEQVAHDPAAPPLLRFQARVDALLATVIGEKRLSDAGRQAILDLAEAARTVPHHVEQPEMTLDQVHLYLGKKLMARGEVAEGLCLLARTRRMYGDRGTRGPHHARYEAFLRAQPVHYDQLIALLEKPDKTPFEHYLVRPRGAADEYDPWHDPDSGLLNKWVLLDYKAMALLREGFWEEAATAWREIPDTYWRQWPFTMFADDDPFVVDLKDPHNYGKKDRADHAPGWAGYTKRSIMERMIALRDEAERDPKKRALNHLLLGHVWYNMSWHGKYWIMQRIDWSTWDLERMQWTGGHRTVQAGDEQYYGLFTARHHYRTALEHAKDPALKALACHLAEECERQWRTYQRHIEGRADEPEPYAARLKDRRSRMLYRDLEECRGYDALVRRFR
ncbi:MAG: hypothetical protein RBT71_00905 [Flavobacteriales bacterium]|jgi:hypothetical protein|nr:hypothetical protein [Flavobacteriales bacterium]